MRSIKPGRAPSWVGVIGGIVAAIFGIFWIGMAANMGAPPFFIGFGAIFILIAIGSVIFNFYNATTRNRFSHWDITESHEERDPLDPNIQIQIPTESSPAGRQQPASQSGSTFCPYCGSRVQTEFEFCPDCGKRLPNQV